MPIRRISHRKSTPLASLTRRRTSSPRFSTSAEVAAPLARDIMVDTLTRDPANRKDAPGQRVADAI